MRGSVKVMNNCIHPDHSVVWGDGDGDEEGEEGCGDCVDAV